MLPKFISPKSNHANTFFFGVLLYCAEEARVVLSKMAVSFQLFDEAVREHKALHHEEEGLELANR